MKRLVKSIFTVLFVGWLIMACQQNKKSETSTVDQPKPVATLSSATYTLGDSILIQLSQPLSQVSIAWDTKPALAVQPTNKALFVHSATEKVGLHTLIVNGITANKTKISDTLGIELWSDRKPQKFTYSVLKTYPHQASSFTQGLEFHGNTLYEGTGHNGQSKLMKIDLATGSVIQSVSLPEQYFGEGITIANDRIYQLTWTSGQCFRYKMDFTLEKTFIYHTEGWGLTHTDSTLIVSDGSNKLSYYTADFQKTGELTVYDDKGPVMNLNELEYVNGYVLANVWKTNRIVQIDLTSGKVVGEINISSTLPAGIDTSENVLNGIAYKSGEKALYITGKNWPSLFKIQVNGLFNSKANSPIALR
ncbi:glutaminyl-peptide cyclotransferase [Spirosoma jeollabukense]